jgi:hypothetical protein
MRSVSCSTRIVMITLALLFGPASVRAQQQAKDLPPGKEVLDRYIEVTGGREAYERVQTRVATSTIEAPAMGLKGKLTIYQKAPDQGYLETDLEGVGRIEQGTDGQVVWERSAMMGPRLMEGAEKEALMRSLTLHSELHPEKHYEKIETVGVQEVGGRQAYKVEMTSAAGTKETRYYDHESGLLLRSEGTQKTQMGEIQVSSVMEDYQTVDGLKMPKRVTQEMMGQTISMTIDKIEHGVDIPDTRFEMPQEVRALVEKKTATPTQPGN